VPCQPTISMMEEENIWARHIQRMTRDKKHYYPFPGNETRVTSRDPPRMGRVPRSVMIKDTVKPAMTERG
jgi:hypothetical protein